MLTTIFLVVTLMQTLQCQGNFPQMDLSGLNRPDNVKYFYKDMLDGINNMDYSDFNSGNSHDNSGSSHDNSGSSHDTDEVDVDGMLEDMKKDMSSDLDSHSGRSHVVSAAVFGLVCLCHVV